jgi:hypothetical protein
MRTPSNSPNHAHTFVRLDLQRLRTSGLRIDGGGMATCSTTRGRSSTIAPVSKVSTHISLPHHEHFPHLLHNVTLCLEEFSPPVCDLRGQQLDTVTTSTVGWPTRHARGWRSLHDTECGAPHICRFVEAYWIVGWSGPPRTSWAHPRACRRAYATASRPISLTWPSCKRTSSARCSNTAGESHATEESKQTHSSESEGELLERRRLDGAAELLAAQRTRAHRAVLPAVLVAVDRQHLDLHRGGSPVEVGRLRARQRRSRPHRSRDAAVQRDPAVRYGTKRKIP